MTHSRFKLGRWVAALLAIAGLGTAIYHVVVDNMPKGEVRVVEGYTAWSEETLELARTLPVQDGGRIKPLSTYAGFTMLQLHGARSMKLSDGAGEEFKIKPTAWLLDTLFRPQWAVQQPVFRVDNSAALEAIGVESRGRRDRYSYQEIEPGRDQLIELAQSYQEIESGKRDPLQSQIVDLASNLRIYESLFGYFTFARSGVLLKGFGDDDQVDRRADISAMMLTSPKLREHLHAAQARGEQIHPRLRGLLDQVLTGANFSKFGLFLIPPTDGDVYQWQSAGEVIMGVMSGEAGEVAPVVDDVVAMEALARAFGDEGAFRDALKELRERLVERATERGEYEHVELETSYYQRDWFLNALAFFLIGTLSALAMWSVGYSKTGRIAFWLTAAMTALGGVYCVIAITIRCLIMDRPPVGNLYDTIIFIGASLVLLSLVTEWMTRKRFAMGLGPILGTALILLARRYELGDASDHMDPLVAVLDSNYWLTTHVITITLGYSAGLLSAFLSAIYVLMRGLGLDAGKPELRRSLTRAVYGMICFTLFLSLVGTVLGGIWANDSWGRFWGWDPKENGALLIVLWALAILHARMGGYLREWGLHLASLFTAAVVTFSWWHVNFLGVGLHNYGFTSGKDAVWVFYIAIAVLIAFGAVAMAVERSLVKAKA